MSINNKTLCQLSDIPEGSSKGFSLTSDEETQDIFIVNRDNQLFAYKNQCPHTGAPLNWQPDIFMDIENYYIQCSIHGAKFDAANGLCVWGPCVNQSLTAIKIRVVDEKILLTIDD